MSRLIPLYAIGVFLSFTLSQTGMVRHWQRVGTLMKTGGLTPGKQLRTHGSILEYDAYWTPKMILNGVGATITAIVTVIFLVSKFSQGAWITAILIPGLLALFFRIHHHYRKVARMLSTEGLTIPKRTRHVDTLILVGDIHRETLRLVEFANALGVPWKAVHIAVHEDRVAKIQQKWQERVGVGDLIIVPSPYRSLTRPLRDYVMGLLEDHPDGFIHIVMGQLRTRNPLAQFLHQNAHLIEQVALQDIEGVVTTVVTFQLDEHLEPPPPPDVSAINPEIDERVAEGTLEVPPADPTSSIAAER